MRRRWPHRPILRQKPACAALARRVCRCDLSQAKSQGQKYSERLHLRSPSVEAGQVAEPTEARLWRRPGLAEPHSYRRPGPPTAPALEMANVSITPSFLSPPFLLPPFYLMGPNDGFATSRHCNHAPKLCICHVPEVDAKATDLVRFRPQTHSPRPRKRCRLVPCSQNGRWRC